MALVAGEKIVAILVFFYVLRLSGAGNDTAINVNFPGARSQWK